MYLITNVDTLEHFYQLHNKETNTYEWVPSRNFLTKAGGTSDWSNTLVNASDLETTPEQLTGKVKIIKDYIKKYDFDHSVNKGVYFDFELTWYHVKKLEGDDKGLLSCHYVKDVKSNKLKIISDFNSYNGVLFTKDEEVAIIEKFYCVQGHVEGVLFVPATHAVFYLSSD